MNKGAASRRMGGEEWGLLALLSLVWGGSFFFYKVLVQALPPFTVVLGRMAIAALALNLWLAARRQRLPLDPKLWAGLFVAGVLNNALPFSCFAFAEQRITSGLAAILNATTPLFGVLVGAALRTGAPLTPSRVAAVAIGFLGVTVLVGPSALRGGGDLASELACLLATLSYAFGSFHARRFSWMGPLKLAAGQTTAAALAVLPLAAVADRRRRRPLLGLAAARPVHLGRPARHRHPLNRLRLFPVLPAPGTRRAHRPDAGHLPGPGQRARPGRAVPERVDQTSGLRGHGPDRPEPGGDRWPASRPALASLEGGVSEAGGRLGLPGRRSPAAEAQDARLEFRQSGRE
jgi:drug/metabolite transporter (DMT)-like permease